MTKQKKLTTAQAWRCIAKAFKAPAGDTLTKNGLCYAVGILFNDGKITAATEEKMREAIHNCGVPYLHAPWFWPKEPRYRLHRARLAERFAREAEGQKKKR